jgi:hypothetical protein
MFTSPLPRRAACGRSRRWTRRFRTDTGGPLSSGSLRRIGASIAGSGQCLFRVRSCW